MCAPPVHRTPWSPFGRSHAPLLAPPPAHTLAPPSPRAADLACPPFGWAGGVCVQPAAELRHVQRHHHGGHVSGALGPCPAPSGRPCDGRPPRSLHLRRPTRTRLPARVPPALNVLISTGQSAGAFNQPLSFDTSSVTTMAYMFVVRSARAPHRLVTLRTLAHTLLAPAPSHTLAPPSPRAADLVCPPFGWAGGVCVQPAAELRHIQH